MTRRLADILSSVSGDFLLADDITPCAVLGGRIDISGGSGTKMTFHVALDARNAPRKLVLPIYRASLWFTLRDDGRVTDVGCRADSARSAMSPRSRTINGAPLTFAHVRKALLVSVEGGHVPLWDAFAAAMRERCDEQRDFAEKQETAGLGFHADKAKGSYARHLTALGSLVKVRDRLAGRTTDEAQRALQTAARIEDERAERAEQARAEAMARAEHTLRMTRLGERSKEVLAILNTLADGGSADGLRDLARTILLHVDGKPKDRAA